MARGIRKVIIHHRRYILWYDGDGFNLMAKDMYGDICGEHYDGIHALSEDGIHWDIQKGKLFFSREILWDDGVRRRMGNLERPFLLFENGKPTQHGDFVKVNAKIFYKGLLKT